MKQGSGRDLVFDTFIYIVLTLFMFICIYPFYYIFIYSISDPQQTFKGIYLLPQGLTFENYMRVLKYKGLLNAFGISASRAVVGSLASLFCCALYAYTLTKKEMLFRTVIYRLTVASMYISFGLIPYYLTIRAYGLRNNYLVYILPLTINAFYVILLKTYIEQLPLELEESAMIDGAGYFKIFTRIILPISGPIAATIVIFASVGQWNSWFDNYMYATDKSLITLQYLLLKILQESQSLANTMTTINSSATGALPFKLTPEAVKMTITMVVIFPILLVYPFMQKYFVKGIMLGAIKG